MLTLDSSKLSQYSKQSFGTMARGLHIPLPQPPLQRRQSSPAKTRQSPLTPSTVTPPAVSSYYYSTERASKDESRLSDAQRASALLAKVASKNGTPMTSPVQTPAVSQAGDVHSISSGSPSNERHSQKMRDSGYWSVSGQQGETNPKCLQICLLNNHEDGYISFPDFERYCQNNGEGQAVQGSAQHHQHHHSQHHRRRKS